MQQNLPRFLSFGPEKQRTGPGMGGMVPTPDPSRWCVRRTVMWTMLLASLCLALSAAAGIGEARLLAERGVSVTTVAAEDGSRWIQANGTLYEARTDGPTAIADPRNHNLNATSIGEHLRSATVLPAALALLALAVALGIRSRTPDGFAVSATSSAPAPSADILEFRRVIAAAR